MDMEKTADHTALQRKDALILSIEQYMYMTEFEIAKTARDNRRSREQRTPQSGK